MRFVAWHADISAVGECLVEFFELALGKILATKTMNRGPGVSSFQMDVVTVCGILASCHAPSTVLAKTANAWSLSNWL